jgi:preprotein translocase subunit SecD
MDKNLTVKSVLIIVLIAVAVLTLYPPTKTLKPGIDLAGGTSLVYEIDAQGLEEADKKDLSGRMITVLRRRIDPANIQNLIWRPQGNVRFEIQMPLASAKARAKRWDYDKAKSELLEENINKAVIIRSLGKPPEERAEDFNDIAKGSAEREEILKALATAYDEHKELRGKSDALAVKLESEESKISAAGLDLEQIKLNVSRWAKLDEEKLAKSLTDFLGSDANLGLVSEHVKTYAEWDEVTRKLTDEETGASIQYKNDAGQGG